METHQEKTYDFTDYYGGIILMDRVQMGVDSLLDAIKDGEVYRRYVSCEEKLREQPELREKIDEFRAAVFKFNNEEGNEDLFEEIDRFERQYQDFRMNPVVNEFLEAELDVCRLLQRVVNRIQVGVDIQIPRV